MKYTICRFIFPLGAHFGRGILHDSDKTFRADTLFSALFIEAIKAGTDQRLLDNVNAGKLLFSDAFPFEGDTYYLPKPLMRVKREDQGNSIVKKKIKKLQYITFNQFQAFIDGTMELDGELNPSFAEVYTRTQAMVRTKGDTEPFHVGQVLYREGCGLYIIAGTEDEEAENLIKELLQALSYTGIGGEKSSGLGKFHLEISTVPHELEHFLLRETGRFMLLSGAIPGDEEMENVLMEASYLLEKRGGFVASESYAPEYQKKRDLYVFAVGSCFSVRFSGKVADVSEGGAHPVYRYARAMFMGV